MKKTMVLMFLCLSVWAGVSQAQLKVDFTLTNGAVEDGYQGFFGGDKPSSRTYAAHTYVAFDTNVIVRVAWASNVTAACIRMIDRTATNVPEAPGLMRDWIGTDTRQPGDPMTLTISGLPVGKYEWVSYHHDRNDQTGVFQVTVTDATGSKTTTGIDISNGQNFTLSAVTKFATTIYSNGRRDITLVFDQTSSTSAAGMPIFVMNGFDLTGVGNDQAILLAPQGGASDVRRDGTVFSWIPSAKAVAHDVYLGTNRDEIDDGMMTSEVYKGRYDVNNFDAPRMALGLPHYWRVDEVAADGTVAKGDIWTFTVEPVSIRLGSEYIEVAASSVALNADPNLNSDPNRTIDGSGLSAADVPLHSIDVMQMWLSDAAGPEPVWIQYEFDRAYKLHEMWVWNYNGEGLNTAYGFKGLAVDYSVDGVNWKPLEGVSELPEGPGTAAYAPTVINFGDAAAKYVKLTANSNWSNGWFKQSGLSEVRFMVIPAFAREPQPASGATSADPRVPLSWRAGRDAAKHNVYLSEDVNAVIDGTASVGTVSQTSLDLRGLVTLGRHYYWKVDEVNELNDPPVVQGETWEFTVRSPLPVEDFEGYTEDWENRQCVYQSWIDGYGYTEPAPGVTGNGSGAAVGHPTWDQSSRYYGLTTVETGIVRTGSTKSMPLYYDGAAKGYSEAGRTFNPPQDWTLFGAKTLMVWFYGDPNSTSGQMYVKVNGSKVAYDSSADNLKLKPWQLWRIDLSSLTGVDLHNVTSLAIGLEGGAGRLFIDDIALSPDTRQLVVPTQPAMTNLVAYWAMEGNTNSSAGTLLGTVTGAPTFVPGKVGQAIKLNGATDHVDFQGSLDLPVYSAAMWFRVVGGTAERDLLSGYNENGHHGLLLEITANGRVRFLHRAPLGGSGGPSIYSIGRYDDGIWYHVVIVKSADGMTLYINGVLVDTNVTAAGKAQFDQALTRLAMGVLKHDGTSRLFPGEIDEVYLYNRVLSPDEIAGLAGRTTPFDR